MKRFQFRLQTVLEQRKRIEDQAKMSYAEAQHALARGEQLLAELREVRTVISDELALRRQTGDFDPDETRLYFEYLQTVTTCIQEQVTYMQDLASTTEARRLHLLGASQGRQVMDKMRERAVSAHEILNRRREQVLNDEMAASRHQFQQMQAGETA